MNTHPRITLRHFGSLVTLGLLASLLILPSRVLAAEAASPLAKPVDFDTHTGYFVSNKFEPAARVSFAVLRDQAGFDQVFGVAMVMGDKSHRLPPAAFDTKIVVAAIHRGKGMVTYQVESVVAEGPALVVRYTTKTQANDTAEFACPLILSLDKGDFTSVRFIENGKPVKRLEVAAPPAAERK